MLTPLDLAHVRALNPRQVRQAFLGDAVFGSQGPHRSPERLRRRSLKGRRPGWSAPLDHTLLHGQERRGLEQFKPRYV
jgi:hypothetical protein